MLDVDNKKELSKNTKALESEVTRPEANLKRTETTCIASACFMTCMVSLH